MTIEILISPTLSSPFQSVELHYYRCPCHYDDQRQHCSLKEDSIFEHRCIYSSAAKVQTHEQAVQSYSLSSRPQSMRITPPPTVLFDRVNGGKQKEYDSREDHDHHSTISCKKCVRFNLESSEVIPYLHCKDMTDEEMDATWFTFDEKKKFRREATMTKRLIEYQQMIQRGPKLNIINEKNRYDNHYSNKNANFPSLSLSFSSSFTDEDEEDEALELCERGLEGRQQRLIGMSRHVVFEEQERQDAILRQYCRRYMRDTSNKTNFVQEKESVMQKGEKMIATRYRNITEDAVILARQRARQDYQSII
mmetsp:Transcript_21764/g.24102  ORF Transcript_21764/g.24102 Transcript_21764/m.24102 type:complete len:307 (-) Transcript_21764:195-1115(-)